MARVLIVVPSREPLVESAGRLADSVAGGNIRPAADVLARHGVRAAAAEIGLDERVRVDERFPAVPIGTAQPGMASAALVPGQSANFVIRAEVPDDVAMQGTINGARVFNDPKIAPTLICGGDAAVGGVAEVEVLHLVQQARARGANGNRVAIAIMDSGISAAHLAARGFPNAVDQGVVWNALPAIANSGQLVPAGGHPADHGTMCGFDALIAAPDARLLDYPILHEAPQVAGSGMSGTLSDALQAYAHLEAFWSIIFGPSRGNYDSLVINNSWAVFHPSWDFPAGHPGRYIDNPNHPFNLRVDALARAGVDILFAAGNCGSECPDGRCEGYSADAIVGANAHPSVLTVAGIGTDGDRVGYSSEGPPITGLGAPLKPDLACATHFDGSGAFGADPDSGTSAACPVAAGCVAALRSRLPQSVCPPQRLFNGLRQTARQLSGAQGWNPQTGHGVLDLAAACTHFGL